MSLWEKIFIHSIHVSKVYSKRMNLEIFLINKQRCSAPSYHASPRRWPNACGYLVCAAGGSHRPVCKELEPRPHSVAQHTEYTVPHRQTWKKCMHWLSVEKSFLKNTHMFTYPCPELLIQSTGNQTTLKENTNPVVVFRNCSLLWHFRRLSCGLWPLCGRCVWIHCVWRQWSQKFKC